MSGEAGFARPRAVLLLLGLIALAAVAGLVTWRLRHLSGGSAAGGSAASGSAARGSAAGGSAIPLPAADTAHVQLVLARAEAEGVTLRWRRWPGADAYEVRFYDQGLSGMGWVPAGADTAIRLRAGGVPALGARDRGVMFRVFALRGSEVLSATRALPLPR